MESRKPELLGVGLEALASGFEQACAAAGLSFRACAVSAVSAEVKERPPDLLIARAELTSGALRELLTAVAPEVGGTMLPIALICDDTSERRFLKGARTSVVELLPNGLLPAAYVARLRSLLHELPQRSGSTSGEGDAQEVAALIVHLRMTFRSGALRLHMVGREPAHVAFLHGQLRGARMGEKTGDRAVQAILATDRAAWTFTEVGGGGGEGAGVVIEVGKGSDEPPRAPPVLSRSEAPTVLVVDDDPVVCRYLTMLFEKYGYAPTSARDGIAGYEAAVARPYDLVTADLRLPRLDGWGMLRLLREDHRTREVPLAFLSCDDRQREQLAKLEIGAQAFLPKDMGMEALLAHVADLLEPRVAFRRAMSVHASQPARFGVLGPQWTLREVARTGKSARIAAKDAWATYELFVSGGQLAHAVADTGQQRVEGARALMAWILSRSPEGEVTFGSFSPPTTVHRPLKEELEAATSALNERDRTARHGAVSDAADVEVNAGLYELYARVAPEAWQPIAHLVCRERIAPREVAARVNMPATEVQEAIRDLFRRGVVNLRSPRAS